MRELAVNAFMALEGVVQAQSGPESLHRREQ
jgi:hypothetical protein